MKKILWLAVLLFSAALMLSGQMREEVSATFGGNVGFDDFSRAVEVSVSQNPVAAAVFGMRKDDAVQVFTYEKVSE